MADSQNLDSAYQRLHLSAETKSSELQESKYVGPRKLQFYVQSIIRSAFYLFFENNFNPTLPVLPRSSPVVIILCT